jgi:hypothetical protein
VIFCTTEINKRVPRKNDKVQCIPPVPQPQTAYLSLSGIKPLEIEEKKKKEAKEKSCKKEGKK